MSDPRLCVFLLSVFLSPGLIILNVALSPNEETCTASLGAQAPENYDSSTQHPGTELSKTPAEPREPVTQTDTPLEIDWDQDESGDYIPSEDGDYSEDEEYLEDDQAQPPDFDVHHQFSDILPPPEPPVASGCMSRCFLFLFLSNYIC